jgi:hypothetical protein
MAVGFPVVRTEKKEGGVGEQVIIYITYMSGK